MTKTKKLMALLLVVAMLFTFVSVIAACQPQDECEKNGHTLTAVAKKDATLQEAGYEAYWKCDVCGKLFSDKDGKNEISKPVEIPKLTPEPTPHVCGHKCPTCGKCTDSTCTDPVCADKCQGHGQEDGSFTPITKPVAGRYYMGMKCSGDVYYYLKGGMNGYFMATSSNKDDAVIVDLIADGDGWLLKQGNQYMEIEVVNGHINAVYKEKRTVNKNWAWDETYNIFTWENGTYFYGTYGTFNTIGGGNYSQHAASNYKAQLGTFGNQEVIQPDPESITLNKSGTLYLAPQSGNYIQLNATVQPVAASQDVEWSSSNEQTATVQNGKVTYVGAGQTTITATAKGTDKKVEITVVVTDKGSKEQPLSVDEAIALMDTAGDGVTLGDANNKFYITGKVEEGSVLAESNWTVNLLGTDSKKLQAVFDHSTAYSKLYVSPESGKLDNYTLVLQVSLKKDGGTYTVVEASVDSGTRPAVASIKIDETAEVKMPIHAKLEVKEVLPANAQLDGTEQWHSSDESKATVDNKGEVTGVSAGEVQVWVSFGEIQSNKCNVTVTAQESSSKVVYDWTTNLTADSVVDDVYTTSPSSRKDHKTEYLDAWTPGQTEITALKFSVDTMLLSSKTANAGGFAYDPAIDPASVEMTTSHQIKKVTFKVVPFTKAKTIKFSVNGQQVVHEKGDATYDGKLSSAFEVTIDLSEASNSLKFEAPLESGNAFAIVGMTFEW